MKKNIATIAAITAYLFLCDMAHGAEVKKTERTIDGVVYVCTTTTTPLKDGRLGVKRSTVCVSK